MISLQPIRTGAGIAIGLIENFFGIPCDVYYPKGFEKSGRMNTVKYGEEPDMSTSLVLIDPYTGKVLSEGGISTNLGDITMVAYVKHNTEIYRFSRIDAKLGYTINKYQVINVMTHNDIHGPLYKKLELMSISETIRDEEIVADANQDFIEELEDNGVNYNNSIVNSKELEVDNSLKYSPVGSRVSSLEQNRDKIDKTETRETEQSFLSSEQGSIIDRSSMNQFKANKPTSLASKFRRPEVSSEIKPDPNQYTRDNSMSQSEISEVKPLGAEHVSE